jgi:ABC-type lipoprotein export system ATPase subunit
VLTVSDVSYRLPDGRLLYEDVSFTMSIGETVIIEGPSGSGKSTLLALIGGLLAPTSGTVTLSAGVKRPITWVLQGLNALMARTVVDNVCLDRIIDGEYRSDLREEATEALSRVGLDGFGGRRARVLSGGELQRMSTARALMSTRPVILADEPTSQLDHANAKMVMSDLTEKSSTSKCAVVIVTHDTDVVPPGCRRLRLHDGKLIETRPS